MARTHTRAALFFIGYARQNALERAVSEASAALSAVDGIGTGRMGLTPDTVKASPHYRTAHVRYMAAHDALRQHNASFVRTYGKELNATRRAIRAASVKG